MEAHGWASTSWQASQPCLPAQAHDNDQPDTNNSLLHFSLLPSPYSRNFSVDPDKGILRNLGPLDREAINPTLGGRIVLSVNVSDSGEPALWTTVSVTITVEVRPGSARDGVWDEPRIGRLPRRWPVLPPAHSNHISALAIWRAVIHGVAKSRTQLSD